MTEIKYEWSDDANAFVARLGEKWWECEVCHAAKINTPSGSGCCCPNGHGGITPGRVTEEKKPAKKKAKPPFLKLLAETRTCSYCPAWAVISRGRRAACAVHNGNL